MIDSLHRHIGWDHHHIQPVNLSEFISLGIGGASHTRQAIVQSEVVLEGSRCQSLTFRLDLKAFFRLNRLM